MNLRNRNEPRHRIQPSLHYHLPMPAPPTQSLVLIFEDARRVVEHHASHASPKKVEALALLHCAGRVLAEPVTADRDIPPFPRSTRDGYAVHAADLAKLPAKLKIIGEIKAGPLPDKVPPKPNRCEAISIMTGAPVPQGADSVVMVENTSQQGDSVGITKAGHSGRKYCPSGRRSQTWRLVARSRHAA